MVIIRRKLRNYLINTMEGAGAPATSFEDIGKSRFMQLSTVKRVQVSFFRIRKRV